MKISDYIEIGDKVRYNGEIIEVKQFTELDKRYSLKNTDQLYKNNKLFAYKTNNKWVLAKTN